MPLSRSHAPARLPSAPMPPLITTLPARRSTVPSSRECGFYAHRGVECVYTRNRPTCKLGARGAAAALCHVPAWCGKQSWTCPGTAIECGRVRILVR